MNDKIIGDMSRDELMDYIIELDEENGRYERRLDKLQSNWNSLREWLEVNDRYSQGYFKQALEYMNELERKDKNEDYRFN